MTNIVEVVRSFSRKVNLGNIDQSLQYESIDLFCSMKAEIPEGEDPSEASQVLQEMCKAEVMRDAKEIKERIKGAKK